MGLSHYPKATESAPAGAGVTECFAQSHAACCRVSFLGAAPELISASPVSL